MGKSFKSLTFSWKKRSAGRNSSGRITVFHRGGGSKKNQRRIDFQRFIMHKGQVVRMEYDPCRTTWIALVRWSLPATYSDIDSFNTKQHRSVAEVTLAEVRFPSSAVPPEGSNGETSVARFPLELRSRAIQSTSPYSEFDVSVSKIRSSCFSYIPAWHGVKVGNIVNNYDVLNLKKNNSEVSRIKKTSDALTCLASREAERSEGSSDERTLACYLLHPAVTPTGAETLKHETPPGSYFAPKDSLSGRLFMLKNRMNEEPSGFPAMKDTAVWPSIRRPAGEKEKGEKASFSTSSLLSLNERRSPACAARLGPDGALRRALASIWPETSFPNDVEADERGGSQGLPEITSRRFLRYASERLRRQERASSLFSLKQVLSTKNTSKNYGVFRFTQKHLGVFPFGPSVSLVAPFLPVAPLQIFPASTQIPIVDKWVRTAPIGAQVIACKSLHEQSFVTKMSRNVAGNSLFLCNIPIGTRVHNVELTPKKGAQICRAAGTFAELIEKMQDKCLVRFPSGKEQYLHPECRATIGILSNSEHQLKKLYKAGQNRWYGKRPTVRGVAMNPIDHPHGGGEGRTKGGRPSVSPWGKPSKGGFKTALRKQRIR